MKNQKKKKVKKESPSYLPGSRVKMTFVKHALPPLAGLAVMLLVLGLFNSQWIAAKIYDLTYDPPAEAVIEDKKLAEAPPAIDPNAPPKIIINNLEVEAPVIYGEPSVNENRFQLALRRGVVHYPGTATPDKPGNVVIFGHSSGQVWAPGDYKFVFMRLDKLKAGDKIFLEYQGIRYTYDVKGLRVVAPTEVSVLEQGEGHNLTLITCTPVGTDKKRLIVSAELVSPKPAEAKPPAEKAPNTEVETLPSQSSAGFWESIRTWFQDRF